MSESKKVRVSVDIRRTTIIKESLMVNENGNGFCEY